jgi:hypothetical protein
VVGECSQVYPKKTNRVIFPSNLSPILACNRAFAAQAIRTNQNQDGNAYFTSAR